MSKGFRLLIAFGIFLGACSFGALTPEKVSKRLKHGSLVADRSRVCMLQDTYQAQSVLPIPYNGKTYYG
ncbi:MAG: hypothetical protein HYT87_19280 [Nitrospirae bacterium]|nr:hypothetical protein [Nitrospirota bacterium]